MTTFQTLELIYDQFLNLSDEIKTMIENEEYEEVSIRLQEKENLLGKLFAARKTIELSEENKPKLEAMDKALMKKDKETLDFSEEVHKKLGEELKNTNKKVKVNSAYSIKEDSNSGTYINISE